MIHRSRFFIVVIMAVFAFACLANADDSEPTPVSGGSGSGGSGNVIFTFPPAPPTLLWFYMTKGPVSVKSGQDIVLGIVDFYVFQRTYIDAAELEVLVGTAKKLVVSHGLGIWLEPKDNPHHLIISARIPPFVAKRGEAVVRWQLESVTAIDARGNPIQCIAGLPKSYAVVVVDNPIPYRRGYGRGGRRQARK